MAAVASASKSVAAGDWSKYIILERLPLRTDISKEFHFGSDQLSLRVIARGAWQTLPASDGRR